MPAQLVILKQQAKKGMFRSHMSVSGICITESESCLHRGVCTAERLPQHGDTQAVLMQALPHQAVHDLVRALSW